VLGFTAILCIALGAGAAGALNQWYEADLDAKMKRTAGRPLPAGRMDRQSALHFGVGLACFSLGDPDVFRDQSAATLILAVSILFYVFVYTIWLKRRTPQNIVIGGAAGAFPPLIGWAAATGDVALLPVLLFALDLPVDAAAFLGARAVREDRLRQCRRADAAGGGGRAHYAHPDRALHASRWSPRRSRPGRWG
jgi:4-hydroxybenzoate polyprenyltransferase